jgi:hypothetical protein
VIKAKDILSGWKNYLIDDPVVDKIAEARAKVCALCPEAKDGRFTALLKDYKLEEIQGKYCHICKCPLSASVRSKSKKCPLDKW